MAGIIAQVKDSKAVQQTDDPNEAGEDPKEEATETPEQEGAELTPDAVRSQMQIPPELQDQYQRLVLAGKKVLYSEQMSGPIQELLKGPGSLGAKLGQGVLALLAMLIDKANGTLPPQLIIPAGVELVVEAGNFLKDAGQKVTKNDIAEGTAAFVSDVLQRAGVSLDQLPQLLAKQGAPEPDGDEGAAPTAPDDNDGQGV